MPEIAKGAAEVTGCPILTREDLWSPEIIALHVSPLLRRAPEDVAA